MGGKVAVRVSAVWKYSARPSIHRWDLNRSTSSNDSLRSVVCSPTAGAILHYFNCGGMEWFAAKYCCRVDEAQNRLWFHRLAQAQARQGRRTLQELHDAFAVQRLALEPQLREGLVEYFGPSRVDQGSFWGWSSMPLG